MVFDKYLYAADYDRDQVIILTTEGSLIKCLGVKGKGPGEFLGASQLFKHGDTLWVYNDGKRCFEVFNSDSHLQTVKLPDNLEYPGNFKFFRRGSKLFMTSVSENHSICSFDVKTHAVWQFGDIEIFDTDKHTRIRNQKHLFATETCILAVSDNLPVIEKYDYSGTKLETYDYSQIPLVRKRLRVIRSQSRNPDGYSLLVQDVCYDNNNLYLLLYANNGNRISCNNILEINVSDNNTHCLRLLNLGDTWYNAVCVADGILYTYGKNSLERFSPE
jgi:hypothetical protein